MLEKQHEPIAFELAECAKIQNHRLHETATRLAEASRLLGRRSKKTERVMEKHKTMALAHAQSI
mgnify:CR=1 FL=1